jgi:prepilin-type N-terminal cleavage/methylation domain-containing protein
MDTARLGLVRRGPCGFSLIELLVVVAIISIILGMYMSTFSKVLSRAEQVAVKEGMRQGNLGRLADNANSARSHGFEAPSREACRAAYRQTFETAVGEVYVTEVLYRITNDAEFRAYWYTMINPDATHELEFEDGALLARDEHGDEVLLVPLDPSGWGDGGPPVPRLWSFLSTNMGEMSINDMGIEVMFTDGHVERIAYRHRFPATPTVAELSHRFLNG